MKSFNDPDNQQAKGKDSKDKDMSDADKRAAERQQESNKSAQDAKVAQTKEAAPPKVEEVDMERTARPEAFKPENPDAVVVAKPHPANPSHIATQNVMRSQADPKSDKDLAAEAQKKAGETDGKPQQSEA